MQRMKLPCGQAPSAQYPQAPSAQHPQRPAVRAPLQLESGRVPFPGHAPQRRIPVTVPTATPAPAPRGPLLLGPGRVAPSYEDARRASLSRSPAIVRGQFVRSAPQLELMAPTITFQPTASQEKRIAERIAETFGRYEGHQLRAGFLPLRVDVHPTGRMRLVFVYTEVPEGIHEPGKTTRAPGYMTTVEFDPERDPEREWKGEPYVAYDPDPQWMPFRDVRWAPTPSTSTRTYHTTSEQEVDASGLKQPKKVREVRDGHWRTVARLLHQRAPVAYEVLDEYPALAQFFAQNLAAAQSVAEIRAERDAADNPDNPDITVHWSVENGLLLHTRGKIQSIIDAIKSVRGRGMGFKWSRTLGAWYRPQSVGVSESTTNIDAVAKALRDQGMVVAVERGETKVLGEANERRQEHKFWRAEGYAGRAEGAIDKSREAEEKAAAIREQVPVGAATRKAERMEARADRAEGEAAAHLEYVGNAAATAQNLARTAAGYDTTVAITRKEAEKRADAFAQLFVRKVKGLVGAASLSSSKKDNLSEYRLTWVVVYPPSAKMRAGVSFDGRDVNVVTRANEGVAVKALRENVTHLSPEEVFQRVVNALPKYVADASALAPTDPRLFSDELSGYGRKRGAPLAKAAVGIKEIVLWPSGDKWGNGWSPLRLRETRSDMAGMYETNWYLVPIEGLRFRLSRTKSNGFQVPDTNLGSIDLDFTGMSIADAWELLLAAVRAIATKTPLVLPKAKKAREMRAPVVESGVGIVTTLPREVDATPQVRVEELRGRLAPITEVAAARLAELRETAAGAAPTVALREAARDLGKTQGFYPTPPSLAAHVVELTGVKAGESAFEPSAGMGALVGELVARGAKVTAAEIAPERAAFIEHAWSPRGVRVMTRDFMSLRPDDPTLPLHGFDVIPMNPPFSIETRKYTDAEHVLHAMSFLRPGGRLVAIMSPGSTEANNARRVALHNALRGWDFSWEKVDPKRFRISGTDVASVILVAQKPKQNRRR